MMYVYMLFNDDDECIYVGQTANVEQRLDSHKSRFKGLFSKHEIIACDTSSADDIEAEMIVKLKPEHNKELPPNCKYTKFSDLESLISEYVKKSLMDQEFAFDTPSNYTRSKAWLGEFNLRRFSIELENRLATSKKLAAMIKVINHE